MFYRRVVQKPLGKILIEKGVITPKQLDEVLAEKSKTNKLIGEILVSKGYAREEDIMFALMSQYELPYLPLDSYELDFELFLNFPIVGMERYEFIPLEVVHSLVSISTSNPLNDSLLEYIKAETGLDVVSFIATPSEIRRVLARYKEQYGLA